MGQCRRCGGIYGAQEMTEGICKECLKPEDVVNKKTIDPNKKIMKIYKIALLANIISLVSFIMAIMFIFIMPIANFIFIIFYPSLIIGNVLSMYVLIKFFKSKGHSRYTTKLISTLVACDGLIVLTIWLLNGSNFHA